ncbi:flavin reductase [Mangrovibacterium lignilyticum]|uniref:flavin reductase n=1 Tax=Mangrovibacterium lignilyticum TaxID=2668052 RepID=UPI0013D1D998|nr:flavin reductase [Mangrovibacterium lignilyticum]
MKLRAFHKLSYGLYIVASEHDGKKAGYIANTVFQVTSKPPLLAISCHKDNLSTAVIRQAGKFSVSVLKKEVNTKIIGEFGFMSGDEIDKFDQKKITTAATGVPIVLDEAVAWFDCAVREQIDLGSHWLIIGEVLDSDLLSEEDALTYAWYREKYKMFSPKNSPTYLEKEKLDEEKQEDAPVEEEKAAAETAEGPEPHVCLICGYVYDPEKGDPSMGIEPGTPFEDLPEDYKCPICNASKDYFKKI